MTIAPDAPSVFCCVAARENCGRGAIYNFLCGLAPDVAGLAAEGREGAGPGLQAADAIVDFARGSVPVDAAVFFFQERG